MTLDAQATAGAAGAAATGAVATDVPDAVGAADDRESNDTRKGQG